VERARAPPAPGRNEIRVVARTVDGTEIEGRVAIQYLPGARIPWCPRASCPPHRASERRLIELQRGCLEIEREAAQQARKELVVELETGAERRRRERAERQRKVTELEPTPEEAAPRAGGSRARPLRAKREARATSAMRACARSELTWWDPCSRRGYGRTS
jgi:hypothetical protein